MIMGNSSNNWYHETPNRDLQIESQVLNTNDSKSLNQIKSWKIKSYEKRYPLHLLLNQKNGPVTKIVLSLEGIHFRAKKVETKGFLGSKISEQLCRTLWNQYSPHFTDFLTKLTLQMTWIDPGSSWTLQIVTWPTALQVSLELCTVPIPRVSVVLAVWRVTVQTGDVPFDPRPLPQSVRVTDGQEKMSNRNFIAYWC